MRPYKVALLSVYYLLSVFTTLISSPLHGDSVFIQRKSPYKRNVCKDFLR